MKIKKSTTLDDYLGVQVIKSKDKKRAWLAQPTIIDALTKKYGKEVDFSPYTHFDHLIEF